MFNRNRELPSVFTVGSLLVRRSAVRDGRWQWKDQFGNTGYINTRQARRAHKISQAQGVC